MPDKNLRDELTELTEAVRELRDREVASELAGLRAEVEKLRAERSAHHCLGCSCVHIHWHQPYTRTVSSPVTSPPYVVTSGTSTATGGYLATGTTNTITSN